MTYLGSILALGLLIAFHEYGHLVSAKLFGIKVDRFSIGFGPPLFSFKRGGVDYTIGAIPLGGFVRVHGMNPHLEEVAADDAKSFSNKPAWQRAIVLASGSVFNYLLAVMVLIPLYLAGTHVPRPMTIDRVEPASAAARAQLQPGDVILSIDGEPIENWSKLRARISESADKQLNLKFRREGQEQEVEVTPQRTEGGAGTLGIREAYAFKRHSLGEAVSQAFVHTGRLVVQGIELLWLLISGKPGVALSSPVGIVSQAAEAAGTGFDAFLRVLVSISVALAVFNLLPIPALDGGRLVFVLIEAIRRKPVSPRTETMAHSGGFLVLMALLLWVAGKDVLKLVAGGSAPKPAPTAPASTPTPSSPDAGWNDAGTAPTPDAG